MVSNFKATATALTIGSLALACNTGDDEVSRAPTVEEMQADALMSKEKHTVNGVVQVPRAGTNGEAANSCSSMWNEYYWWGFIINYTYCDGNRGQHKYQYFPYIGVLGGGSSELIEEDVECACVHGGGGGSDCPNNPPYCVPPSS